MVSNCISLNREQRLTVYSATVEVMTVVDLAGHEITVAAHDVIVMTVVVYTTDVVIKMEDAEVDRVGIEDWVTELKMDVGSKVALELEFEPTEPQVRFLKRVAVSNTELFALLMNSCVKWVQLWKVSLLHYFKLVLRTGIQGRLLTP